MKFFLLSTFLGIALGLNCSAQRLSDYVTAPKSEKPLLSTEADNDLFADFPAYPSCLKRQIWVRNGWKGKDDFSVSMKTAWTADGLYFRFDIRDDVMVPTSNPSLKNLTGDYLMLKLVAATAAPSKIVEPLRVLLLPDPVKKTCVAKVFSKTISPITIGKPETKLISVSARQYILLLKLPTKNWESAPANSRTLRFQVAYGDSDAKGRIDHVFAQVPRQDARMSFLSSMGVIHFVGDSWATLMPKKAKFDSPELQMYLDYGNFSDDEKFLRVEVLDKDKLFRSVERLVRFLPGSSKQGVDVKLLVDDLEKGKDYTIRAKVGINFSPAVLNVRRDTDNDKIVYCPSLIEKRQVFRPRQLSAYRDARVSQEAFRHMAGGGKVLWSAGIYDASSREFPERIRPNGAHTVEIPNKAKVDRDIPWAIFGGAEQLDRMNEPLVLKLKSDKLTTAEKFAPMYPKFDYLTTNPAREKKAQTAKQLFLLGVICSKVGVENFPTVRVTDQAGRLLLERKLVPSTSEYAGHPHSYVLRVWLTGAEKELRIHNSSKNGSRIEIDFLCLMEGADEKVALPTGKPAIVFEGNDAADHLTQILATNMFFARNYLLDDTGKIHRSLPGGRHFMFSLRDHVLLLAELVNWGYDDGRIDKAVNSLSIGPGKASPKERETNNVGFQQMVNAVYNHWRKKGRDKALLDRLWHSIVVPQVQNISASTSVNQLGLVGSTGELGTPSQEGGATVPIAQASRSAVKAGIILAEAAQQEDYLAEWKKLDASLAENFQRYLVTQPGGQHVQSANVFKDAHGLVEQRGIKSFIPERAWLYARNANREPIPYNGDIRVFDTPYLFAGIPLLFDSFGYQLSSDDVRQIQRTMNFIRKSPVTTTGAYEKKTMITYKSCETQLWTAFAMLGADNMSLGGKLLDAMIAYNYDEYASILPGSDINLSPFALKGKFNVGANGDNIGGTKDQAQAGHVALLLKTARLIAGIDGHDHNVFKVTPRLPLNWKSVQVTDWVACHDFGTDNTANLSVKYERQPGGYDLNVVSNRPFKEISVRIGPFPRAVRNLRVVVNGKKSLKTPVVINGSKWVIVSKKQVLKLKVNARQAGY